MTNTLIALLGFSAWTLFLLAWIVLLHTFLMLTQGRAANSFKPDASGESDFSLRLTRAHANCYESLPVAVAVLLTAIATNNTAITAGLALFYLAARLIQSSIHLISTSPMAVQARGTFQLIQIGILAWWIVQLARTLLG